MQVYQGHLAAGSWLMFRQEVKNKDSAAETKLRGREKGEKGSWRGHETPQQAQV